jgi:hypothetical protein
MTSPWTFHEPKSKLAMVAGLEITNESLTSLPTMFQALIVPLSGPLLYRTPAEAGTTVSRHSVNKQTISFFM